MSLTCGFLCWPLSHIIIQHADIQWLLIIQYIKKLFLIRIQVDSAWLLLLRKSALLFYYDRDFGETKDNREFL